MTVYQQVFFCLGSNQGDRLKMLDLARELIEKDVGHTRKQSSIYETEPWGMSEGSPFLNQVIQVNCRLSPHELLKRLQKIEQEIGRCKIRDTQYISRCIDIDILFYGNEVIEAPDLRIPHPGLTDRRFVLVPLAEIAGDFVHPGTGKPVNELLAACSDPLQVKLF